MKSLSIDFVATAKKLRKLLSARSRSSKHTYPRRIDTDSSAGRGQFAGAKVVSRVTRSQRLSCVIPDMHSSSSRSLRRLATVQRLQSSRPGQFAVHSSASTRSKQKNQSPETLDVIPINVTSSKQSETNGELRKRGGRRTNSCRSQLKLLPIKPIIPRGCHRSILITRIVHHRFTSDRSPARARKTDAEASSAGGLLVRRLS